MGIVDPKNCAEVRLHLDERADTIRLEITMRRDAFNEGCADFDAFLAHHQRQVPEPYTKDADLHLIQSFAWAYEMFYTVDATSMPAPTCLPELRKVMDRCPPVQPDVAPLGENSVDLQGDNSPLAVPRVSQLSCEINLLDCPTPPLRLSEFIGGFPQKSNSIVEPLLNISLS